MGYNLGRSGSVSVKLEDGPPFEFLRDWVIESYRAIAAKRLVAELDAADLRRRPDSGSGDPGPGA